MKTLLLAALISAVGVGLWASPSRAGQHCVPDGRGGFNCTYVPECRNPWQLGGCYIDKPKLQQIGCFTQCTPGNPTMGLPQQCCTNCN